MSLLRRFGYLLIFNRSVSSAKWWTWQSFMARLRSFMYIKKSNGSGTDPSGSLKVRVGKSELKLLIETDCFLCQLHMIQTIYLIFLLFHNDLFFIICCDQQYQRPFEDQQIYRQQRYLHQELSLLTQLDWKVHRKLNATVESQTVVNTLTCISPENHKSCYTPYFPRFYHELTVVILVYSFRILILILFYQLV